MEALVRSPGQFGRRYACELAFLTPLDENCVKNSYSIHTKISLCIKLRIWEQMKKVTTVRLLPSLQNFERRAAGL